MSTSGALLEAGALPFRGMRARLVRGSLMADGLVVWANTGRCGLKFDGLIDVKKWLTPVSNSEQGRVDQIVHLVKSGTAPLAVSSANSWAPTGSPSLGVDQDLAEDLSRVAILLQMLGDELSDDTDVIIRHGARLQNLDIVLQTIVALEASIRCGPAEQQPMLVKLKDLRKSAVQALKS